MKEDVITEEAIRRMVDGFYAKVRQDAVLGPVFDAAIGDGWPEHLAIMYGFWSSMMLATGRYKGSPMAVHRSVAGIERSMFPRWLDLFEETVRGQFTAPLAEDFLVKARRVAQSLAMGLFFDPGRPLEEFIGQTPLHPLREPS